jgi:transposase
MRRPRTNFPQLVGKCLPALTELASGGESVSADIAQSAYIILLMHEGMTVKELAAEFGLSKNRVITLRQRFMTLGLPGLQRPAPTVYGSYLKGHPPDEGYGIRPFPRPKKKPLVPQTKAEAAPAPMLSLVPPLGPPIDGQVLHPELAREAHELLKTKLTPEQRLMVRTILEATDSRLTLSDVARRAGVSGSTVAKWWRKARHEGLEPLLKLEA